MKKFFLIVVLFAIFSGWSFGQIKIKFPAEQKKTFQGATFYYNYVEVEKEAHIGWGKNGKIFGEKTTYYQKSWWGKKRMIAIDDIVGINFVFKGELISFSEEGWMLWSKKKYSGLIQTKTGIKFRIIRTIQEEDITKHYLEPIQ